MFGAAWTWSKTMDLVDGNNVLNPFVDPKVWNYGKAGYDRTHTLVINFDYYTPEAQRHCWEQFDQPGGPGQLGNFRRQFIHSGEPMGFTYTLVSTTDITGGGGLGVDVNATSATSGVRPDLTASADSAEGPADAPAGVQYVRCGHAGPQEIRARQLAERTRSAGPVSTTGISP